MEDKENVPKFDECKRIDNKYKNINHMKFLYELYAENDYKIKVKKEKFDNYIKEYNEKYNKKLDEKLDETDYLKYLVMNNYIRNKIDFTSTNIKPSMNDEMLNWYIDYLKKDGVYFLKFYENEILNESIKDIYKIKDEFLKLQDEIFKLQGKNKELKKKLDDSTKEIISIMGLFSAIIGLIISNISVMNTDTTIFKVVIVNASLILSITAIFFFIDYILNKKYEKNKITPFVVVAIICIAIILISLIMSNNSLNIFCIKLI